MGIDFTGSTLALVIVLFAVGLICIIKGGDLFVDAATWIAEASGIPKFIIGATVVSFATTMPEMLVSVFSAFEGNADIAVGNAVGSVTANTGLIMCLSLVCMSCYMTRKQFGVKAGLLLAAVVLLFEKQIIKYRHRSFVPDFTRLNKFTIKHKKAFALLFLLLLAPAYLIQKNIDMYYSMDKALPSYLTSMEGLTKLKDDFGMACTQFVIIDDSLPADKLIEMENKLEALDGVTSLLAYNSIVGAAIPDTIIPDDIMSLCKQDGKQLMMINSEYGAATDELTAQLVKMDAIVKSYDQNAYITGEGAITQGLIDTTDVDFAVTAVLSIAAIFVLIAICFKSPSLPVILVLSIELAIWINLSITVIMGTEASFVDPTVVNCVQLGATVDYAILLTTRFREELRHLPRDEAMLKAVSAAQQSIFQSAGVFFAATFGVYLVCDIYIVRGMCALLARGAIISEIVIIVLLSPVLCVCESFIAKTTPSWRLKT